MNPLLAFPAALIEAGFGGFDNPLINHRLCNGSDAVSLAMECARKTASVRKPYADAVVTFGNGYHGQGQASYVVSDRQKEFVFLRSDEPVMILPPPAYSEDWQTFPLKQQEFETLKELYEHSDDIYSILLEPIQMNNGANVFSKAYLQALRDFCDGKKICFGEESIPANFDANGQPASRNIMLVFDEVQTGFGWLGNLSAAEYTGVRPDIIAFGKGVTAGHGVMAGIIMDKAKYEALGDSTAALTNGGGDEACVVGMAVLERLKGMPKEKVDAILTSEVKDYLGAENSEAIEAELRAGLLARVPHLREVMDNHFVALKEKYGDAIQIRGTQMMRAIVIDDNHGHTDKKLASEIVTSCLENGLFVRKDMGGAIVIKPPLIISEEQLAVGFSVLDRVLGDKLQAREQATPSSLLSVTVDSIALPEGANLFQRLAARKAAIQLG